MEAITIEIKNKGEISKERIVFKANKNLSIGNYIVMYTKKIKEDSFNPDGLMYLWFEDRDIEKNDLVVLYTKKGKNSVKEINDGNNKTYFYYMNKDKAYFDDSAKAIVLIESDTWSLE